MSMAPFKFRDFQTNGINQVAALAGRGIRRIVFQAPTGAGKTILFCGLADRFRARYPEHKILIAVNRQELMNQTVKALQRVTGIEPGMLMAGYPTPVRDMNGYLIPHSGAQVVVAMVETLNNRFKKYDNYMGGVGMLIIDECHRGEFNKIYTHFPNSLIVGFTATPISANKRIPLKTYFDEIVSPVTINELIQLGHLARNITITVKNAINRKKLAVKGGDFDERQMGNVFSTPKHVENCVKAYEQFGMGQKTIIFNCNIEHSNRVNDAFIAAGYNSRHMDSNATEDERKEILTWFASTDDAILNNVALYTTGFDEPTIQNVIINRATMSLPLWLQMCGRASRSIQDVKDHFKILDLGANLGFHLDWNYPHDWTRYFHHPEKVGAKKGAGPTKLCPQCEAMIHLSTMTCPYCEADLRKPQEYDQEEINLEILTKGIDIEQIIKQNEAYRPYRSLHMVKVNLVRNFRMNYKHTFLDMEIRERINNRYQELVRDWCREQNKEYDQKHKWMTRKWLMDELDRCFGKIEKSPEKRVSA